MRPYFRGCRSFRNFSHAKCRCRKSSAGKFLVQKVSFCHENVVLAHILRENGINRSENMICLLIFPNNKLITCEVHQRGDHYTNGKVVWISALYSKKFMGNKIEISSLTSFSFDHHVCSCESDNSFIGYCRLNKIMKSIKFVWEHPDYMKNYRSACSFLSLPFCLYNHNI